MPQPTATAPIREKSHFEILDGLRGVAAVMVVCFHTFEAYAGGSPFRQIINHGYMAVDFFFLLSGFVIAYAYDDRWNRLTQWEFYKRRLIRLQPMVIMGSLIGAATFYLQKAPIFSRIASTTPLHMFLIMLIGFTLLPIPPSMDIRGWDEMHPLNGPAWSLFFEYIANIAYAVGLRRASKKVLALLALAAAIFLVQYLLMGPRGDVIGGWAIDPLELHIGFARLCYPFLAGMLLMRLGWRIQVRQAFLWCSLLLIAVLAFPRVGGPHTLWKNGLYESLCILFVFPFIVAMGAGETITRGPALRVCKLLGALSYPLYITHYPLIYIYTAWVTRDHVPARLGAIVGVLLLVTALTIAWLCLRFYDEPVRAWLSRRFLPRNQQTAA